MSRKGKKWITETQEFQTTDDPYLPKKYPSGEAICPRCHAVFRDKRWLIDEEFYQEFKDSDLVPKYLCPGCRKAVDRYPMGYLYLSGEFFNKHRDEILRVINNEYERARKNNPLQQIISMYEEDGRTVIETTTENLAQRLGRAVYRAYKGDLTFKWSEGNKLVRVYWQR
ncbi:BCAM0308 family protein [Thermodesulfatator atlanticus]|uniref:BCAM0308 family protein n=1 Tax=Thermodesulfatator atlanticus TaxID=501497 RepID=UPI0003B70CEC|nr:BCAM0308 family protein [Thermodesulfatator atlanticus]